VQPSQRLQARFSMINVLLPQTQLLGALAHELMHGFLSAFRCAGRCQWIVEATASWAEDFAYPFADTEHTYADSFFADPTKSLDDDPSPADRHKNGAYLFLLFLQHRGSGPDIVRDIWQATERYPDPLTAIDATVPGGFKSVWRQFMIDNWNAAPALINTSPQPTAPYDAWDHLTTGVFAGGHYQGPAAVTLNGAASVASPLAIAPLPHLSAAYFVFDVAPDVRSVQLTHHMNDLAARVPGAELVVFVKIQGRPWQIAQDWTTLPNRNQQAFCRDNGDEDVQQLVVVISNSTPDRSAPPIDFGALALVPTVVASSASCSTGATAGYEECRVEFHSSEYNSVETQTWQLTGQRDALNNYPYVWTAFGQGSASKLVGTTPWGADWTFTTDSTGSGVTTSGLVSMNISRTVGSNGLPQWQATDNNQNLSVANALVGQESSLTNSGPTTFYQSIDIIRSGRTKRTAPAAAMRIEGTSVVAVIQPVRGKGNAPAGTLTCRWSWPTPTP
jgi:hypothetical protein